MLARSTQLVRKGSGGSGRKREGGGERGFENSSMDLANPDVCCSRQADCDATLGKLIPIYVCDCVCVKRKKKTISSIYLAEMACGQLLLKNKTKSPSPVKICGTLRPSNPHRGSLSSPCQHDGEDRQLNLVWIWTDGGGGEGNQIMVKSCGQSPWELASAGNWVIRHDAGCLMSLFQ